MGMHLTESDKEISNIFGFAFGFYLLWRRRIPSSAYPWYFL